ncbi:AAR2 protein [Musa troglodytarum]|uniref:AAR2 protein n=1 Tax=Musa troglodytarum TaxID=320322 RepID=A0A9E7LEQ2_9LILI|nr:AAR2 protein [Musa troglodytarum]
MDQEAALDLVKKGATLLLLDVPQFTLFGIDTQMFSVGPMFKGMKMIPPGTHFIYYSPSSKEGNEFSPTVGFFLTTHPAEVVVRKWHHQEERLIKVSEDEVAIYDHKYSEAVRHLEFDPHLGPYALDRHGEWKQLSNYITQNIIERIEPIGGDIMIAYESGLIDRVPKTVMERRLMEQLKDSKFSNSEAEGSHRRGCYYTLIPHAVKHKGISGEELTAINLDKTNLLEAILMKDYGGEEDSLLGELQFAFVAFMPLRTRTQLFSKDFFPLVLESPVVDGDLLLWTRKLKRLLETALGWDFADVMDVICDEGDEFSPVIVPSEEVN